MVARPRIARASRAHRGRWYALNLQDGILRLRYRNDRARPELLSVVPQR
jgi:hypothetical protein